jgi:hypothetical protein
MLPIWIDMVVLWFVVGAFLFGGFYRQREGAGFKGFVLDWLL